MQRWVRRRTALELGDWHWLAVTERRGELLRAACGHEFVQADVDVLRAYTDDIPRERRCPSCQEVFARLVRPVAQTSSRLRSNDIDLP